MRTAIKISELTVKFSNCSVLQGLTIVFPSQQITTLVGPSGSGKTTLLRSLNRLNEEYGGCETTGQVQIDLGKGLEAIYPSHQQPLISVQQLRRKVGMLFQTPQLLPVSIYRNIAMPLELVAACPKKELQAKVAAVLQKVGLWDEVSNRLDAPAINLSGGQQQRLCLARALALEPSILLLDEPTASLDIHAANKIEELLAELRTSYTIIMVSHSIEQACRVADQLIVMQEGKIKANFTQPLAVNEIKALLGH